MNDQDKHTDDLKLIRKMMEDSSRFLSLSGLSGVFIGLLAILGAIVARFFILNTGGDVTMEIIPASAGHSEKTLLLLDAILTLSAALGLAYFLAIRESRLKNQAIWTSVTRRLLINLFVPLFAGAFFIVILIINSNTEYLAASMLIFYGLALFNAGKFTFGEVQYLGLLEILTGLCAAIYPEIGLLLWTIGFGLLHILYGLILHRKYK
ncbi:MAG: hypothetical protein QNK33_07825 [Bacteroidales bacterium]|nr:hypothetical protein [Bacteroidales bacterium]